ncbi:MAG TPA: cation transporter [Dysgonomonas sp.]|uniref:heavy-metal-associated domain-containing protein n=1 Tax=Dysgonomonas sp. TaxID=1891233 RepID=UPI002C4924B8|nr:cation transporter [Dysgonomonas sp.]HML64783.1 cation transporter [Dysgonomonas sp.]
MKKYFYVLAIVLFTLPSYSKGNNQVENELSAIGNTSPGQEYTTDMQGGCGSRSKVNKKSSASKAGHQGHATSGCSDNTKKEAGSTNEHQGHDMSAMSTDSKQGSSATVPVSTGHQGHNMSGVSSDIKPVTSKDEHAILNVQGLCEMCKERIEKAVKGVSGVSSASWDQKTKQLHLNFDGSATSVEIIGKAIAKAGHDADKYKADKATYAALPNCCKYRK